MPPAPQNRSSTVSLAACEAIAGSVDKMLGGTTRRIAGSSDGSQAGCWVATGATNRVDTRLDTTAAISSRMSRQARRDTAPELAVRRELHRRGLRFRVDWPLPGLARRRADVVFTRQKVAIFVDGCFWHSCPEHRTAPASNSAWWVNKLENNVRRDRQTDDHLRGLGWTVLRFWEHENPIVCADEVQVAHHGRPWGDSSGRS